MREEEKKKEKEKKEKEKKRRDEINKERAKWVLIIFGLYAVIYSAIDAGGGTVQGGLWVLTVIGGLAVGFPVAMLVFGGLSFLELFDFLFRGEGR